MAAKKKVPVDRHPANKKPRKQQAVAKPSVDMLGDDEDEAPTRREPHARIEEDGPCGTVVHIRSWP